MELLLKFILFCFVWSTILSIALLVSPEELISIFKKPKLLINGILLSLLLGPLFITLIHRIIPFEESIYIALILYSVIAGAPIGPKFVQIADGDSKYSVLLLAALNISVILFAPFVLGFFMPGDISLDQWAIVKILILFIVIPLCIGIVYKKAHAEKASLLAIKMKKISNILLLVVSVSFMALKFEAIVALELIEYVSILLVLLLIFVLNYILIFDTKKMKTTVALTTLPKNFGPTLAIATSSFADLNVIPYLLVMTLCSMIIGMIATRLLNKM